MEKSPPLFQVNLNRILIIDDDPIDRHLLKRQLLELFPEAVFLEADDEAAAIPHIPASPGFIFLDFHIPGVDEFSLLRVLRATLPNVPIVLYTDTDHQEVSRRAVVAGADAYLPKILLNAESIGRVMSRATEAARARAQIRWYKSEIQALRETLYDFALTPQTTLEATPNEE
ncbi:MAG: response regulator [Myxococcota bacterium]